MKDIENYGNEATYCPEDNKIRLYCGRVPRDEYLELRAAGFKSTPKQDCDFVGTWHIKTEDIALAMLEGGDTIGDEDQSPADRAADRAERFAGYRDKRRGEAHGHADSFEGGPSAFGHQSQAWADRAAARHDRHKGRALTQWDKAEYWQQRTEGVISHAIYATGASVRRGRIVRLEKELASAQKYNQDGGYQRFIEHTENRLAYERQMLASQGGAATDIEIVPGGHFGKYQVFRVNKSPTTKQPVSVMVQGNDRHGNPSPILQPMNIQRLGEDSYRPPTPEDMETLAATLAQHKTQTQAKNAGKPKLVNPTPEAAQRLQNELNRRKQVNAEAKNTGGYVQKWYPSEVRTMTQAQYSENSKGAYSSFNAEYLHPDGSTNANQQDGYWEEGNTSPTPYVNICKVRVGPCTDGGGYGSFYKADSVIVITDKPQKPLPEWAPKEMEAAQ